MTATTVLAIGALALALLALLFAAIVADDNRERAAQERRARRPLLYDGRRGASVHIPRRELAPVAPHGVDPYAGHRPGCGCPHHR